MRVCLRIRESLKICGSPLGCPFLHQPFFPQNMGQTHVLAAAIPPTASRPGLRGAGGGDRAEQAEGSGGVDGRLQEALVSVG